MYRSLSLMMAALMVTTPAYAVHKKEKKDELKLTIPARQQALTANTVEQAKEKARSVPGSVAVVDSEEFENTRVMTVKDMFEFTPGVFAQSRVNEESRLSIRGSGLSRNFHLRGINLYQDGIPVNFTDGTADYQDIDPLALRYVEVYKGANALKLGTASLGGAVNYVTPTGYDASPFTARGELGSFGWQRGQISSGKAIGDTDYFMSFTSQSGDGYRDHSASSNRRFYTNFGQKLNDRLETRLYFTYGDINQELPGNLTKAQMRANPKQANATSEGNNYQRDFTFYRIANKTTWKGDSVTVNGGIYTQQKDLYHPIFQLVDQDSSTYGVFADSTWEGMLGGYRNSFTLGSNLSQGNTDSRRYTNLGGEYGALQYNATEKAKQATIYSENRFYVQPDLSIIAGAQGIYANRAFHDKFMTNGDQSAQRDFYGLSPKIGAIYDVTPQAQLFTNLSRAYEPPIIGELTQSIPGFAGFADLDAQKSTTFEIGTRGNDGHWDWDASIYRAWIDDELLMYNIAPSTSRVLNADKTIHQGLELALGRVLTESLATHDDSVKLRLAYSYSDFKFDGDSTYGDNDIPGLPTHFIRTELRYDHPDGWYVAPNLEAAPDGYAVDMANTLYSSGYAIAGLRAGMSVTEQVELFFDARNLTDKNYAATADVLSVATAGNSAVFSPGDGRSFYTGLTYKF
jgi:iron complex outermembrane receptor protein